MRARITHSPVEASKDPEIRGLYVAKIGQNKKTEAVLIYDLASIRKEQGDIFNILTLHAYHFNK